MPLSPLHCALRWNAYHQLVVDSRLAPSALDALLLSSRVVSLGSHIGTNETETGFPRWWRQTRQQRPAAHLLRATLGSRSNHGNRTAHTCFGDGQDGCSREA